ncbi:MAG: acyl-CoA thioesterase [Bacteroidales bacterium]|nr:acyl-CoA thioesterase [Bacteroidales bacterium]
MVIDINNITFKNRLPIQLRMTDIDALHHVNNGVICSYFDLGRLHYMKAVSGAFELKDIDIVLVHTEYDFSASIRFNDTIAVDTAILEFGTKSVKMVQRIVNTATNKCYCTCYSVLAGYDHQRDSSAPIKEEFKRKVMAYERKQTTKK